MLAKSCNFEDVNAKQYQYEVVFSSFIRGIEESSMRQRLLEFKTLTLGEAINNAEILKRAHENARGFESNREAPRSVAVAEVELDK